MIERTRAKREHNLQSKWSGPVQVKEAKSELIVVGDDMLNSKQQTVHTQRILLYPIARITNRNQKIGTSSGALRQHLSFCT